MMSVDFVKLPRVTDFAVGSRGVTATDFYRTAALFMRRVNAVLDKMILVLIAIPLLAIAWLAFGAQLEDAYVSDGVVSCQVTPLSQADATQVKNVNRDRTGLSAK